MKLTRAASFDKEDDEIHFLQGYSGYLVILRRYNGEIWLTQAAKLQTCNWDVLGSNLKGIPDILIDIFRDVPQFLQKKRRERT
jgi:hypothetical protein